MFGAGINYNTSSVAQHLAYSAYRIDLPSVSENEKIATSAIRVRGTEQSSYANSVYFREGLKGEYVNVGLSDENLQKLREVFGDKDVKRNRDGDIILKGKAEEFVSSWFNDIAYKRGYVKADSNNDGTLSLEEKYNTTAFFGNGAVQTGNNVSATGYVNYAKASYFANANDTAGVNAVVSNSIEDELNRTLQDDKDMDGRIYIKDKATAQEIVDYFREIMGDSSANASIPIPSVEEFLRFLKQTMQINKEILEEELKKAGIDTNSIDLNASAQEVFEKIMKQDNGIEALTNLKERLENKETQSSANLNEIQEENVSNSSTTQENSTISFENEQDEATFNEIAKLTKLDKETLAYNLANNPNFEEDIISIVQELTQNVDSLYSSNTLNLSKQKALDIRA